MESTELEKLQLEVKRELCLLPREDLVELCDYLIIAGAKFEHVTDKGRTAQKITELQLFKLQPNLIMLATEQIAYFSIQ